MAEALFTIFGKIFDKYFLKAIISLGLAVGMLLLIPDDNWLLLKSGKHWFVILCFCVVLTALELICNVFKRIQSHIYRRKNRAFRNSRLEAENSDTIRKIVEIIDNAHPDDQKWINDLVISENKPVLVSKKIYCLRKTVYEIYPSWFLTKQTDEGTLYKLDEPIYRALKDFYEKNGTISHF